LPSYTRAAETLGATLRAVREQTGMSGVRWARRLGWPQSKISRMETGTQRRVTQDETNTWCDAAGADQETRAALHAQLGVVSEEYVTWRAQLRRSYAGKQDDIAALEAAHLVRCYEVSVIPGLCQIPDYARALLRRLAEIQQLGTDDEELAATIDARLRRQEILYQAGRAHILIHQHALTWPVVPPDIISAQLDRLAVLVGLSTTRIGIVPAPAAAPAVPVHGFWLYGDEIATVEILSAELVIRSSREIDLYQRAFEDLAAQARYGDAARAIITAANART
jgi:hypothetical protein